MTDLPCGNPAAPEVDWPLSYPMWHALEERLAALEGIFAALNTSVREANGRIVKATQMIDALYRRVAALEGKIAGELAVLDVPAEIEKRVVVLERVVLYDPQNKDNRFPIGVRVSFIEDALRVLGEDYRRQRAVNHALLEWLQVIPATQMASALAAALREALK